jgi:tetratricopeptide (TPR) repeat protein
MFLARHLLAAVGACCCLMPVAAFAAEPEAPELNRAATEKTGTLPPDTSVLSKKAAAAFAKQDWPTARAVYQEMLKLDDENALVWANLGAVEQQAGRAKEAVAAFERAVRLNPQLAQSWNALGLIHSAAGDTYLAISMFARAIHEDPADARAHNYLAIAAKTLGWTDAAAAALQRAVKLDPEYGIAHFNLTLLYLDQKPPALELARRHYQRALSLGVAKDELVEGRLKE